MALRHLTSSKSLKSILAFTVAGFFACFEISLAQKQSTLPEANNTIPTAMSIAKVIEEKSLIQTSNDEKLTIPTTTLEAISQSIGVITSGDEEKFERSLDLLREITFKENKEYGEPILILFSNYARLQNFSALQENYNEITDYLNSISTDEHWLVQFYALRLLSIKHSHMEKKSTALQVAEEALSLIPNEISPETVSARVTATELIAYLQNLQRNKDLALLNTQRLIDLKLEAESPIDGIELINNLMYVFSAWRDNEVRLELAQTLVRLENKYGSTTPGLSNLHVSSIYIDIGEYEKAISPSNDAVKNAVHQNIKHMANLNLAAAYAGLGDIEKANLIYSNVPENLQDSSRGQYSKTIIALKDGRVDEALSLMNNRFDKRVQRLLSESSNNTNEILASLENSSERQAEREEGLRREAAFIQSRLDQQKKITNLLILLTGLTLITGLGAMLFARKQHKLSKLLAIKSQEAESADRMKTEFLGMMSHELRTPLNGIIGVADVLAELGETQDVRDRGKIILNSGNELFSLIESIIDMSRIDAGKIELIPSPASMHDVITQAVNKWEEPAKAKGLTFTYHIPESSKAKTHIDSLRMGQCVDTLLSNAVKFTETGRIHLHVTTQDDKFNHNRDFEIIVADTGQGMNETVQERLFTPFLQADSSMTRKHGGSGLRLAIARGLMRMVKGDITVNSREGRGSEFKIVFSARICRSEGQTEISAAEPIKAHAKSPKELSATTDVNPLEKEEMSIDDILAGDASTEPQIADELQTAPQEEHVAENSPKATNLILNQLQQDTVDTQPQGLSESHEDLLHLRDCRVLIVENTPSNQDVVEFLLRQSGVQCVSVDSTEQALSSLNTAYFDVIIMDVHMKGDAGLEATRQIRQSGETWSDTPIIALSTDKTAEANAACMAEGIDVFLTKPVFSKDLIKSLRFLQTQKQSSVTDKIEVNRRKAW